MTCKRRRAARSSSEVAVEVKRLGRAIDLGLRVEEAMRGVGVGEVADDDLAPLDRIGLAVAEGIAEGAQQRQRTLATARVSGVAGDGVDGPVGAVAMHRHQVAELNVMAPGKTAKHDVGDAGGV